MVSMVSFENKYSSIKFENCAGMMPKWQKLFSEIENKNLLQTEAYNDCFSKCYGYTKKRIIINIDDQPAGLFYCQEKNVSSKFINFIVLDRGPLWLNEFDSIDYHKLFFEKFNYLYPSGFLKFRRVIPELEQNISTDKMMNICGFSKRKGNGYETILVDLTPDQEQLRASLAQKWRNILNKSEKENLQLVWDSRGLYVRWLLNNYKAQKKERGYSGPSAEIIKCLAKRFSESSDLKLGVAKVDNQPIGAILILCHKPTATYLVGFVNDMGRKYGAHNFLLWNAMIELRNSGIKSFDLGGVNDESAKNIKKFKQGLGGDSHMLPGVYY
jgi:hypothetical protein